MQLLLGAAVRCWWAALDGSVRARVLAAAEALPVYEDAFAILGRALDPRDPAHHYREQFGARGYFAEAAAGCGQVDQARELIESLDALVGPAAAPALRRAVAFASALLADRGQLRYSSPLRLDEHDQSRPFNRARLQLAHARRLVRQRDIVEARDLLHRARDGFAVCGAPPWRDRADDELAALAARS